MTTRVIKYEDESMSYCTIEDSYIDKNFVELMVMVTTFVKFVFVRTGNRLLVTSFHRVMAKKERLEISFQRDMPLQMKVSSRHYY